MLKLERIPVELKTFAPFSNKKNQRGVVLKIEMSTSHEVLDQLTAGLASALYKRPDVISAQTDGAQSPTRFPLIKGLEIDYQIIGATIEIDREDLLGECHMRYRECEITKIEPKLTDGDVDWSFLVKISDPDPADVGLLYTLLKKTVILTLTPPEAATYEPRDPDTDDMFDGEGDGCPVLAAATEIWDKEDRDAAEAAAQAEADGGGEPAPKKRGRKAAVH